MDTGCDRLETTDIAGNGMSRPPAAGVDQGPGTRRRLVAWLAVAILAVAGGAWAYWTSTPEYALAVIDKAYESGNLSQADKHLTPTGKKVMAYVMKQAGSSSGDQEPAIVHRRMVGAEYHIRLSQPGEKGPFTADIIMVKDGWHWQFHDMHILTVEGYRVELMFSYMIDHPWKSAAKMMAKNPMAILKAAVEGFLFGLAL
jgi:hypothetical protein